MSHSDMVSYNRVWRRTSSPYSWHASSACKGFRLHPRRFSVQRLRAKFLCLIRMFNKLWRTSYGHALWSLMKKGHANVFCKSKGSRKMMMEKKPIIMSNGDQRYCRMRSFGRSNSFYSEAIADCLEFIKRSSISLDETPVCLNQLER